MAKVDVVIPCYNYGRFLGACVTSALEQKGVDVNVIIVNDQSTDHSAAVAHALVQQDPRVKLVSLPENLGMIRAVNRGLREITAEYVVKLDADDMFPLGSLQRSVALLDRYPDVGFVYGRPRHFSGDMPRPSDPGRPRWRVWPGDEWLARRCRLAVNCISQPEAVIRSSILREVGDYSVSLPHTSDLEMWMRLAAVSNVGRINGVDQGYYRIHPDSMQRTVNAGPLTDLVGRREAFIGALSAGRSVLREVAGLEATVRKKLASEALDKACRAYDRDRLDPVLERKLVEFAITTFPAAPTLSEWRGLERRRRRGRRSRWSPTSLTAAALRRSREEIAHLRWLRTGI